MAFLGTLTLGIFMGYVIVFGLLNVTNWRNPATIFSAVIAAAAAGGIFSLLQKYAYTQIGDAIYFYPAGLAYGGLCTNLKFVGYKNLNLPKSLHIAAVAFATGLLLLLMFSTTARQLLPK